MDQDDRGRMALTLAEFSRRLDHSTGWRRSWLIQWPSRAFSSEGNKRKLCCLQNADTHGR
jgi:hypothetical protein